MKKLFLAVAFLFGAVHLYSQQNPVTNPSPQIVPITTNENPWLNTYGGYLTNETGLAYNNIYTIDTSLYGTNAMTAQSFYSSTTFSNVTFIDGSKSTGNLTVLSYAALSSATATDQIYIVSAKGLSGAQITLPGFTFTNGPDWQVGFSTLNASISIAAALRTTGFLSASTGTVVVNGLNVAVVYATATYGSIYNSYPLTVNNTSMTVVTPNFTGGADNASLTINGTTLTQNKDWFATVSNTNTAKSIASAINANSALSAVIVSSRPAQSAIVYSTSVFNGSAYNYTITSSTPTAMSVQSFTGGLNPNFTLNSTIFSSTTQHGFTLALPVLYTGSPAIGGLTTGTTYYTIPTSTYKFQLSKYSTSAVAGIDLVTVTSTGSAVGANTYTLAPLAITGTPSFKWQVSQDNINWDNLAVSSVTMTSYTTPPTITSWGFGILGYRWIRLNVVAPNTGGIQLKTSVYLNNQ